MPDATETDSAELPSLSTTVTASISDTSGKQICAATGKLSDVARKEPNTWILKSSSSAVSLWQPQCNQLKISRFRTYLIEVTITGSNAAHRKMLVPVLYGGGNELP
jgi:hypothetical protein